MNIEEIIRSLENHAELLDQMRRVKGQDEEKGFADTLREAAALLSTHQDAQPNEPLTLEELREMDGQPVWIDFAGGFWALVDAPDRRLRTCRAGQYSMYHLVERIYRRPPKED